ncbi:GerMN domain-containing protein [Desulfoscipio gibsoniae]|uniref:Spore germination protein n=1 Tax=Desulfoscipio gibsoniae DSM 7213 TaxID=767817 RepID=R4KM66_9FIRM|nr:GerMN domain-containing protein [Desulfoscipio gibsoniae]AGL01615.1 spore germination protein [Desulfoscipio gibsoniae DSM 7213]
MKAAIKFFIYLGLIIVALYSSGCASDAQVSAGQNVTSEQGQVPNDAIGNQTAVNGQTSVKNGQEMGSMSSNNAANSTTPDNTADPQTATGAATTTVVLYFADADGYLQAERRSVNKTAGIARQAMQELCRGPRTQGLSATMPDGTRLLDINIRNGLCTVNFSRELVSKHSGGSGSENATVYSIVNTLTQFSSVEQVQILVDGQVVESIAGHLDVSVPLTRDSELIRASAQVQYK